MSRKGYNLQNLSPAAQRALVDECMRQDLISFVRKTFETIVPGEKLHLNWHIRSHRVCLGPGSFRSNKKIDHYCSTPSSEIDYDLSRVPRLRPRA